MRNAVSHGGVSFEENASDPRGATLVFFDQRFQRKIVHKCVLKIRLPKLNPVLKLLRDIIYLHIHNLNKTK
jgi:hypothetical protein